MKEPEKPGGKPKEAGMSLSDEPFDRYGQVLQLKANCDRLAAENASLKAALDYANKMLFEAGLKDGQWARDMRDVKKKLEIAVGALRYYAGEAAWVNQRLDRSETAENALKEIGE